MMHVDISFSGFTAEDMIAIGDGLRQNHTILGLHVQGNNAKLDTLGFICTDLTKSANESKDVFYGVHRYDRIPGKFLALQF